MTLDYKKIGLKVGLEIHQQLEGKKLFCSCPTKINDFEPDRIIKRDMRAVAGETGKVDAAAAHEHGKEKYYMYYAHNDSSCLVELDEEPPHNINNDALNTVLMVSKTIHAKIIDEIQVMRKTVVDGSNVSGFQRTALVAIDGSMETSEGKITIPTICLEEDAAKIVKKTDDYSIYNLSRLGIPLIEIGTGPDIRSPQEAKEAAEQLGMILRSTRRVKRGLGTIRQDVNVSIKGGERVEIKGAQDLKLVPLLVENEIKRQQSLIKLKNEVSKTKIKDEQVILTNELKSCDSKIIQNTIKNMGTIAGIKVPTYKGLLGKETQPGKRLGSEISDYAKIKAGVGGLFHSDELPKYGITDVEVKKIRKKLGCKENDAFIIIADSEYKVKKALTAAVDRLNMVKQGVIKEVRMAKQDGTTTFLRPMPGAARMYPETDVKPIIPNLKNLPKIELITDKANKIKEMGLSHDLADLIAKQHKTEIFESFVRKFKNLKPAFIAETMLPKMREIKRKYDVDTDKITDDMLELVFEKLNKGEVPKEALEELFVNIAKTGKINFSKPKAVDDKQIEKEIKQIIEKNKGAPFGALMGQAMAKFRGKVDGKKVNEILKSLVK